MESNLIPLLQRLVKSSVEDSMPKYDIVKVNEYTIENIKSERSKLDETGSIESVQICSSYHGGPLDYPKAVNSANALVSAKWDASFESIRLKKQELRNHYIQITNRSHSTDNSDDEVFTKLTAGIMKPDEDEDDAFVSAVTESASKLFIHSSELIKIFLQYRDSSSLLLVIGGVSLIRNKMWTYGQVFARSFDELYCDYCRLLDSASEQTLEYYCALIATTVIHDPSSEDWTNPKPFYEGEKISHCIQMWWYFIQGLKSDLWNTIPAKTAQKILASVFEDGLAILTVRYSKIVPSSGRIQQFRGDVTALLTMTTEVLTYLSGSLYKLFLFFRGIFILSPENRILWSIQQKATQLYHCLTTIGAPLKDLAKLSASRSHRDERKEWIRFIRGGFYADTNITVLLAKLVAGNSEPIWALVVQSLLCRNRELSISILENIGSFVPSQSINDKDDQQLPMIGGCGHLQCSRICIGTADLHWPKAVGFGVMKVLSKSRDPNALRTALSQVLRKLSPECWEVLDGPNLWNFKKKSIWFHGLVSLLEPFMTPIADELIDMMASGEAWTVSQVSKAMDRVMELIPDVVSMIPISILKAIKITADMANKNIKPLCGSVMVHFLIACLYGIVTRLQELMKKEKVQREKLDFMIAFGEALLKIDSGLKGVDRAFSDALVPDEETSIPNLDGFEDEFSHILAENLADDLLEDEGGQFALMSIYRFVCYNVDWIQSAIGKTEESMPGLIKPWGRTLFPLLNPYDMISFIGGTAELLSRQGREKILQEGLGLPLSRALNLEYPWEEMIDLTSKSANPSVLRQLLHHRPEFLNKYGNDDEEITKVLKQFLKVEC